MIRLFIICGLIFSGAYANSLKNFEGKSLLLCSGAGLIKPMTEIVKNFENETNGKVDIHYGGSGELFATLSTTGCDIFLPGAFFYTKKAEEKGFLDKTTTRRVTKHIPTFVVQKGNPKNIHSLSDLTQSGLKIALGDPRAVPIGKVAVKMLKKSGNYKSAKENISIYAGTVNQLLIYMAMEQVDVAIIWEDMLTWAKEKGKLEVIPIPKNENIIKTIPTAVGSMSKNREIANSFNEYLVSEESKKIWKKWGFKL